MLDIGSLTSERRARDWKYRGSKWGGGRLIMMKYCRQGKYHFTIDLLFDWFEIGCMTTDNFLLLFAKPTNPNQSNRR